MEDAMAPSVVATWEGAIDAIELETMRAIGLDAAGEVCGTLLSLIGDAVATATDSRYDIERRFGGAA